MQRWLGSKLARHRGTRIASCWHSCEPTRSHQAALRPTLVPEETDVRQVLLSLGRTLPALPGPVDHRGKAFSQISLDYRQYTFKISAHNPWYTGDINGHWTSGNIYLSNCFGSCSEIQEAFGATDHFSDSAIRGKGSWEPRKSIKVPAAHICLQVSPVKWVW